MEVHFTPEMEKKIVDFAAESGRRADDFVEDAMVAYFEELLQAREMLGTRYDDLASGSVVPIDGEKFFEDLRRREEELLQKQAPK